jgi:methylated-DNA-[protein]-cysteine S-methyltransferase
MSRWMSSRSAEVAFVHRACATPVGTLTLVADDAALVAVLWPQDDPARVPLPATTTAGDHPILIEAARQIDAYFARALTRFTVPLRFIGTDFQRAVWQALLTIPYGETRSYGAIARQIGRPAAIRAVGAANGRNPISILAPCHRVVGAGGALTGFAGGLAVKRRLLELESPTLFA